MLFNETCSKTQVEALEVCKKIGGKLFEPLNSDITQAVADAMLSNNFQDFWIGMQDKNRDDL